MTGLETKSNIKKRYSSRISKVEPRLIRPYNLEDFFSNGGYMKKINLEFFSGDVFAKVLITENDTIISEFNYYNAIKLYNDLDKIIICGNIYSTRKTENKMILKSDDGCEITLTNLKNPIIMNKIERILFRSFNNIFNKLKKEPYECIYLTSSNNRSNIGMLTNSPVARDKLTMVLELELDSNGLLTEISKKELDAICDIEFRNWVRIFISNHKYNNLKIGYDSRVIITNSKPIIDSIKPKVDFMEGLYLKSLEKREEEFYEQSNNGKTSKFV